MSYTTFENPQINVYGNGEDGDLTINVGSTVTMTSDMYWRDGVINGTLIPNGYIWHFSRSLSGSGTIKHDGNNASGSTGGTGAPGTTLPTASTGQDGQVSGLGG